MSVHFCCTLIINLIKLSNEATVNRVIQNVTFSSDLLVNVLTMSHPCRKYADFFSGFLEIL